MKYFAVSDVHSFYDPLVESLRTAGFFEDDKGVLVLLGDALDRGEDALKVVDFLLELHKQGRLIYIKGNHEELLEDCIKDICYQGIYEIAGGMSHHYINGTFHTMLQLAQMSHRDAVDFPESLVRRVLHSPYYDQLLPTCVNYFETERYVFCHGWIPVLESGFGAYQTYRYNPDWRAASDRDWSRARWNNGIELACKQKLITMDKITVCGHYHTSWGHSKIHQVGTEWGENAVFTPFRDEGIIAIDACTAYTGKINCVVFDEP